MPRYFFDVHDNSPSLEEVGEELPNDEAAWHEATITAGEIFKNIDGKIRPGQKWSLDVADQNRNPLFLIRISTKRL
jgi:Domain of unknown function (DUF6894)